MIVHNILRTRARRHTQSRDTSIRHFIKRRAKFLPSFSVHNANCENSMQGARLVNKGGQKKKQSNIWPRVRKKLHSFRKKRNKSCLCFDSSFIHSFNINFKVRSQKMVTFFLLCFWELIFSSHESKWCWTVHRDHRINCYSVAIRAKQSGTVKTVEHFKNDYYEQPSPKAFSARSILDSTVSCDVTGQERTPRD